MSRPGIEEMVYLKLTNSEVNNENEKEEKLLKSNSKANN